MQHYKEQGYKALEVETTYFNYLCIVICPISQNEKSKWCKTLHTPTAEGCLKNNDSNLIS